MTSVLERYDEHQFRDPGGENGGQWAKQPGMPFDDYATLYDVYDESSTDSGLTAVSMSNGDLQLAFDDPSRPDRRLPLLDLDEADMRQVRGALAKAVAADVEDDWELTEDGDVWFRVSRLADGVALEVPGEDWSATVDADEASDLVDAIDEQMDRIDELDRSGGAVLTSSEQVLERKYNPAQMRDPGGEHGGQWVKNPASAAVSVGARDTLKLAGKIHLETDEHLIGSGKVDADAGGIRMALTEHNGERKLRFGAGGEDYGKRNADEGIAAWDGNPRADPPSEADVDRLRAEADALDEEWDSASPARQAEITERLDNIREQRVTAEQGFNGTTELDEYSARRLADRIRPAMADAVEQEKAENKAWDEIEELEAAGNPDPERMARLRQIVDRDHIVFDKGIVPGSRWGDVHWSVELDDPAVGPQLRMGVQPKDASGDWGDTRDWQGTFDPAETRKFLRQLEKMFPAASRARAVESGPRREAPAGRSRILAAVSRALGEHRLVDGACVACADDRGRDDDQAVRALVAALDEIERFRRVRTEAGARKYGVPIGSIIGGGHGISAPKAAPAAHTPGRPNVPATAADMPAKAPAKAPTGKPKRVTHKERLVSAINDHLDGRGDGDPLAGFTREQLRLAAKERGVPLDRGESRESIGKKLIAHARGDQPARPEKPTPAKAAKKSSTKRIPAKDAPRGDSADSKKSGSRRVAGNDLFAGGAKELAAKVVARRDSQRASDLSLAAIGQLQGYDGKPRVVSKAELDRLVEDGHPEMFRGVTDSVDGSVSARQILEETRSGHAWYGTGIYGNGYYWGDNDLAAHYAKPLRSTQKGEVARAVLGPDAKVIDYWKDLDSEHREYMASLKGHPDEALLRDVYGDPGRYAAARGYDAILIAPDSLSEKLGQKPRGERPWYNILNRTALVIEEAAQ